MTAYPPEWYTGAELDAPRRSSQTLPMADTKPDLREKVLTLWAKATNRRRADGTHHHDPGLRRRLAARHGPRTRRGRATLTPAQRTEAAAPGDPVPPLIAREQAIAEHLDAQPEPEAG